MMAQQFGDERLIWFRVGPGEKKGIPVMAVSSESNGGNLFWCSITLVVAVREQRQNSTAASCAERVSLGRRDFLLEADSVVAFCSCIMTSAADNYIAAKENR